jgi:hypothetical protein
MRRLRNRKGVFVVLFGLLFMVLMAASAMAIDMSRIWTMRNELQTAADAGALAGAVQLTPPHVRKQGPNDYVQDSARWGAKLNKALYDTVQVDAVTPGIWDDAAQTFTSSSLNNATAVEVTVSHPTNKLIIGALGIAAPRVKARAVAWANAPVDNSNCMKPWTMPYTILMDLVNKARIAAGDWPYADMNPDSYGNLTRDFTDDDRTFLANNMTDAQRTFTLKMGSSGLDDPPPGAGMPGNFQAVKLPRKQSAAGTPNPEGPPQNGASGYGDAIEGINCYPIGVGDVLETNPGDMVGPTLAAVEKQNGSDQNYICASIVATDGPTFGNCMNDQGGVGVDIKTAFHQCLTGCTGQSDVTVRLIGSFTLTKMYPKKGTDGGVDVDKAQIVGVFKPLASTGPVGAGPTTIQKIILVR